MFPRGWPEELATFLNLKKQNPTCGANIFKHCKQPHNRADIKNASKYLRRIADVSQKAKTCTQHVTNPKPRNDKLENIMHVSK